MEKLLEELSDTVARPGPPSSGAGQMAKIEGKLDSQTLSNIAEHQNTLDSKLEKINDLGLRQLKQFDRMQEQLKSNSERIDFIEGLLRQEGVVARVLKL